MIRTNAPRLGHKGTLFSEIIRGASSMEALFELPTALNSSGYLSVPSPQVNAPIGDEDYFQGGYNIEVHGSTPSTPFKSNFRAISAPRNSASKPMCSKLLVT